MELSQRTIAQYNAQSYLDDIYDKMRQDELPEDLQIAIISQLKSLLQ